MIERGFVEASSYTPSRVLSPTLHAVGDFVEIRYHSDNGETSSSSQTQTAVQTDSESSAHNKQTGLTFSSWKSVEESVAARANSDALTFIPCESGSVGNVTDIGEIVVRDKSPLSAGDAAVKYGDDSPGVHSAHSKTGITLSDTSAVPASSKTAEADIVSTEITTEKTSGNEVDCSATVAVTERANGDVNNTDNAECQANKTATETKAASDGICKIMCRMVKEFGQNGIL